VLYKFAFFTLLLLTPPLHKSAECARLLFPKPRTEIYCTRGYQRINLWNDDLLTRLIKTYLPPSPDPNAAAPPPPNAAADCDDGAPNIVDPNCDWTPNTGPLPNAGLPPNDVLPPPNEGLLPNVGAPPKAGDEPNCPAERD